MPIKIQRNTQKSPYQASLWTILTSTSAAKHWKGREAPLATGFPSEQFTLLFFRSEGCVTCGEVDMAVGHMCSKLGIHLIHIDLTSGETPREVYDQKQLILDEQGLWNRTYQIGIYPTFVFVAPDRKVVFRQVGTGKSTRAFPDFFEKMLLDGMSHQR